MGVTNVSPDNRLTLSAILCVQNIHLPVLALVDSGAEQSLISLNLVEQLQIQMEELCQPLSMSALTGLNLFTVTHKISSLHMVLSGNHHELGEFFVFQSPTPQVILGFPWLQKHNPVIDWSRKRIISWSESCSNKCLRSAVPSSLPSPSKTEEIDLTLIPPHYHDLAPVFSKSKALSLPPHHPYDCAIELLPGAPLPSSRLYNLSGPERESMREYIESSLASGIIRPSTSPVGAGGFFCCQER